MSDNKNLCAPVSEPIASDFLDESAARLGINNLNDKLLLLKFILMVNVAA